MRYASWIALVALGLLARTRPRVARLLAVLIIGSVGIGHGANDDRIVAGLLPRFPGGRRGIALAYALLTGGVFASARSAPRTAQRALIALSCFHFGSGDAAFARACGSRDTGWTAALLRGAVPLLAHRRAYRHAALGLAAGSTARLLAGGSFADALDVFIPAFTIAATPEPLGFALYFGAWHAPRHMALVLDRDTRPGTLAERIRRITLESMRNTLLAGILGSCAALLTRGIGWRRLFTAATLAITVPHHVAVWYAERRFRDM